MSHRKPLNWAEFKTERAKFDDTVALVRLDFHFSLRQQHPTTPADNLCLLEAYVSIANRIRKQPDFLAKERNLTIMGISPSSVHAERYMIGHNTVFNPSNHDKDGIDVSRMHATMKNAFHYTLTNRVEAFLDSNVLAPDSLTVMAPVSIINSFDANEHGRARVDPETTTLDGYRRQVHQQLHLVVGVYMLGQLDIYAMERRRRLVPSLASITELMVVQI